MSSIDNNNTSVVSIVVESSGSEKEKERNEDDDVTPDDDVLGLSVHSATSNLSHSGPATKTTKVGTGQRSSNSRNAVDPRQKGISPETKKSKKSTTCYQRLRGFLFDSIARKGDPKELLVQRATLQVLHAGLIILQVILWILSLEHGTSDENGYPSTAGHNVATLFAFAFSGFLIFLTRTRVVGARHPGSLYVVGAIVTSIHFMLREMGTGGEVGSPVKILCLLFLSIFGQFKNKVVMTVGAVFLVTSMVKYVNVAFPASPLNGQYFATSHGKVGPVESLGTNFSQNCIAPFCLCIFAALQMREKRIKQQQHEYALTALQQFATNLTHYNIKRAEAVLEDHEGFVDPKLLATLTKLTTNLRLYRQFLPDSLLSKKKSHRPAPGSTGPGSHPSGVPGVSGPAEWEEIDLPSDGESSDDENWVSEDDIDPAWETADTVTLSASNQNILMGAGIVDAGSGMGNPLMVDSSRNSPTHAAGGTQVTAFNSNDLSDDVEVTSVNGSELNSTYSSHAVRNRMAGTISNNADSSDNVRLTTAARIQRSMSLAALEAGGENAEGSGRDSTPTRDAELRTPTTPAALNFAPFVRAYGACALVHFEDSRDPIARGSEHEISLAFNMGLATLQRVARENQATMQGMRGNTAMLSWGVDFNVRQLHKTLCKFAIGLRLAFVHTTQSGAPKNGQDWVGLTSEPCRVSAAIHCGEVFYGAAGDAQLKQLCIMGPYTRGTKQNQALVKQNREVATDLELLLEAAKWHNAILVSGEIAHAVQGSFHTRGIDCVRWGQRAKEVFFPALGGPRHVMASPSLRGPHHPKTVHPKHQQAFRAPNPSMRVFEVVAPVLAASESDQTGGANNEWMYSLQHAESKASPFAVCDVMTRALDMCCVGHYDDAFAVLDSLSFQQRREPRVVSLEAQAMAFARSSKAKGQQQQQQQEAMNSSSGSGFTSSGHSGSGGAEKVSATTGTVTTKTGSAEDAAQMINSSDGTTGGQSTKSEQPYCREFGWKQVA